MLTLINATFFNAGAVTDSAKSFGLERLNGRFPCLLELLNRTLNNFFADLTFQSSGSGTGSHVRK